MTTWTFKTVEKDGTTAYSSAMRKDRALEFICDLLIGSNDSCARNL